MSETVYIIGESRTNMDNAITIIYNSFYMAFEIDAKTDIIMGVGCTHTISITENFIKKIFTGRNIADYDNLEQEVKKRYHGTSQKAVVVSYKNALKKYRDVKNRFYM